MSFAFRFAASVLALVQAATLDMDHMYDGLIHVQPSDFPGVALVCDDAGLPT